MIKDAILKDAVQGGLKELLPHREIKYGIKAFPNTTYLGGVLRECKERTEGQHRSIAIDLQRKMQKVSILRMDTPDLWLEFIAYFRTVLAEIE